ncbi:helix-turn-helix domain-containing protein [Salinibacillus xinjiangensis]|uniref:Helix-turn-helix domain-containing protein n=1 Tax=Salinibacillus xinjiangensis TaxID=1229268 RepID=A0A6G1XB10_9BACI|nr:helix-turn-helix domain-containing protein [Salinibacillus xinjiangensis]MRG88127.1 helix-turn-helix domain-containing protein [Salinibacillus xinjiangensis]
MNTKYSKLIFHPVRMEIMQALTGGKSLSAKQISERISNVPHATLYRHINTLYKAGLLQIVDQNQKRGTIEKIYALSKGAESVPVAGLSNEEHMNYFIHFLAGIINDFGGYLENANKDLVNDGLGYRQFAFHMDDEEFKQFSEDIRDVLMKYNALEPNHKRRKRKVTTIIIPDEEGES